MVCPKCAAEVSEGAEYCARCGLRLSENIQSKKSLPGKFHRFCMVLIAIWTALWAGSFASAGAPAPPTGTAAAVGWTLGAGLIIGAWGFVVVILAVLAIATKPSPSVPWPRSTKLTTGVLSACLFLLPVLLSHSPSSPTQSPSLSSGKPSDNKPPDGWQVSEGTSKMDSSQTVGLSLLSKNPIQGWLETERPALSIRCLEDKTNVYVVTGTAASVEYGTDTHTVRMRFDDGKPITQHWYESTDSKALFAPDAIPLAKRLTKHNRFTFEFTPFQASPAIAVFELNGINKHIGEVENACGWK